MNEGVTIVALANRGLLPNHLVPDDDASMAGENVNPWASHYHVGSANNGAALLVAVLGVPAAEKLALTDSVGADTACTSALCTAPMIFKNGSANAVTLDEYNRTNWTMAEVSSLAWIHGFQ